MAFLRPLQQRLLRKRDAQAAELKVRGQAARERRQASHEHSKKHVADADTRAKQRDANRRSDG